MVPHHVFRTHTLGTCSKDRPAAGDICLGTEHQASRNILFLRGRPSPYGSSALRVGCESIVQKDIVLFPSYASLRFPNFWSIFDIYLNDRPESVHSVPPLLPFYFG